MIESDRIGIHKFSNKEASMDNQIVFMDRDSLVIVIVVYFTNSQRLIRQVIISLNKLLRNKNENIPIRHYQ